MLETGDKSYSYRIPSWRRPHVARSRFLHRIFSAKVPKTKGTFHTNFTLTGETADPATLPGYVPDSVDRPLPDQFVTLSFLDANGRDTIDKVTYNLADQQAGISIPDASPQTMIPAKSRSPS
ncbi:MAG: hypothetical protein ACLR8Y_01025 [Alistipes indistinctus]